jgi:hypothetical protein
MAFFRKSPDPFAERERALKAQIAALQSQIQQLHQHIEAEQAQPKLRSTALPHAQAAPAAPPRASEPGLEPFRQPSLVEAVEPEVSPAHYNEQGLRKYDLFGALRRWLHQLRGGPAASPKLLNYLAAGGIEGLRPLRYEKRVARNRFLAILLLLILIIWGTVWIYLRHR